MALRYSSVMLGTLTIKQPKRENGELVKDDKGRQVYNKFKIDIRRCNALAGYVAYLDGDLEPQDLSEEEFFEIVNNKEE